MSDTFAISLPPTPKQVDYARAISTRLRQPVPTSCARDRRSLSEWISKNQALLRDKTEKRGQAATSKQVAYAERIARQKRTAIPEECFRDAGLMSRWIGRNAL